MNSHIMDELPGYAGKLLRIDLNENRVSTEKLNTEDVRKYLGGVGYGAKILYDELPAGIDPLCPENKIVFATGPITGTRAPGSGSVEVCFKSPLTGIWGEARCGGEWGGALKKAGYDFLVIEGKAKGPTYLVIHDDRVEIRSAERLKGKTTSQKERIVLDEELRDNKFETLVIGPAGENLVKFANIMSKQRAFGRCGAGALMGSKNMLAIAVKGTHDISIAHPEEFSKLSKTFYTKVLAASEGKGMAPGGTTVLMVGCDAIGDMPTKNWRSNSWGKGEELYNHFEQNNLVKAESCYRGCVLRCKRIAGVKTGKWKTPVHEGCEYESMAAFTFFVLNDNMDAAVHADYLCNEYGLDTISTGAVIAFAMDCFAESILSRKETDGLNLKWGDAESIMELISKITNREGLGQILAEGTKRASEKIGKGADKLAIHVKGLEGAAHDPRAAKTQAILYGTNNRGMCHMHPFEGQVYECSNIDCGLTAYGLPDPQTIDRYGEEKKENIIKMLQDFGILPDILGMCKFYIFEGLELADLAKIMAALTGWDINGNDLLDVGERVYNLQRLFNTREGIRKSDDMLPDRCLKLPEFGAYSTVNECEIKNYKNMLENLYTARGWNRDTGIPE